MKTKYRDTTSPAKCGIKHFLLLCGHETSVFDVLFNLQRRKCETLIGQLRDINVGDKLIVSC